MAGLGRRSHYRKHLTDSVLNDLPEITNSNQRIAKVVGTRGSNQFELVVAPPTTATDVDVDAPTAGEREGEEGEIGSVAIDDDVGIDIDMTPQLSILPTKYRKLIWLKRNDYVICECAEDDDDKNQANNSNSSSNNNASNSNNETTANTNTIDGGIRYMITHILYKDQIKHLKEKNMWPIHSFFASHAGGQKNQIRGSGSDDQIREENELLMERAKALIKTQQEQLQVQNNGNELSGVEEGEEDGDVGERGKGELNGKDFSGEDNDTYGDEDNYDYNCNDNDDGIVFSNNHEDYFVNMNRIAKLKIDDSSSDEDSD